MSRIYSSEILNAIAVAQGANTNAASDKITDSVSAMTATGLTVNGLSISTATAAAGTGGVATR